MISKFIKTLSDPEDWRFYTFCQNGFQTGRDFTGELNGKVVC
jgi:hypothetical protein